MSKGASIVISLMAAIMVDMVVVVMCNDVVDMVVCFGVIFIVAGLYWFGRTLINLWHHLYPGIYKAKAAEPF